MTSRSAKYIFYLFVLLFLLDKMRILIQFNFEWTDHDQCTLWNAAEEASHGRFHEPCFYGQSYNSNLEAYVAAPLIWFKVPYEMALPISTLLLGTLAFLLPAWIFYQRKNLFGACALLAVPMSMPVDYQLVMSLPRGFITGIFLVSLGFFLYEKIKSSLGIFFFALFLTFGFWINPNSVLMSVPLGLLFVLKEPWRKGLWLLPGIAMGCLYKMYTEYFYDHHAGYEYHVKQNLTFHLSSISELIQHLDRYFYGATWMLVVVFLLSVSSFIRIKNRTLLLTSVVFLVLFVLTLAMDRVTDGLPTVFYHWGRMYLAVIWMIAFFAASISESWKNESWKGAKMIAFVSMSILVLSVVLDRQIHFKESIHEETARADNGVVVSSISDMHARVDDMLQTCVVSDVDLVVFPENCFYCWMDTYALPALSDGKINTLNLSEDRRGWRLVDKASRTHRRFYAHGCDQIQNVQEEMPVDSLSTHQLVHECRILEIDTNVIDFFRGKARGVRFGF